MSKSFARILGGIVNLGVAPLKRQRRDIVRSMVAQSLIPEPSVETRHGALKFYCLDRQALEYPRDLLTREPETIAWIDGFHEGEVFWDIGANVGAYALYAALVTRAPVLAFEPAAATFATLVRNVEINRLDDRVRPYCIAIAGRTALDTLNMAHTYASSVMHVFGGDTDSLGNRIDIAFRQATPGFRIDDFVKLFAPPIPDHVKIDVDSIEPEIIDGAGELLANKKVRSLLIEVERDPDDGRERLICAKLEPAGLYPEATGAARRSNNLIFRRRGDS